MYKPVKLKLRDCYACSGTGYVHDPEAKHPHIWESKKCPYCMGTGKRVMEEPKRDQ